jgi:branched-chain amino acid transport system ATP-binding protein
MLLILRNVSKRFGGVSALSDVSFELDRGEALGILGGNGSGKSTLLSVLARAVDPSAGKIEFEGTSLLALRTHQVAAEGIVRIWQLLRRAEGLTVWDYAALAFWSRGRRICLSNSDLKLIRDNLDEVGIADKRQILVEQLSYFDRRKLDYVCCVLSQPKLWLIDELTSGLTDSERTFFKHRLLCLKQQGIALIVVEHHAEFLRSVADRILVLGSGTVQYCGAAAQYFGSHTHANLG